MSYTRVDCAVRRRLPTTCLPAVAPVMLDDAPSTESTLAPVLILPAVKLTFASETFEFSVTPFALLTANVSVADDDSVPPFVMLCGPVPLSVTVAALAALKLSVAPLATLMLPLMLYAPVIPTLSVPWVTVRLSICRAPLPVPLVVPGMFSSKLG